MRTLHLLLCAIVVALGWPAFAASPLPIKPDLVVAADGSGDFTSVHAAVQSIPQENRERKIILIKDGVYNEKVRIDAARITLRGESRAGTRIEATVAQGIGRDDRGLGVLNLAATAHDCVIENLTVRNTHGKLGVHAFAIFGRADRTVIQDCDVLSHGNDTLSLWRGRAEDAGEVAAAMPRNDPSILKDGGRYYHARLKVEGSVDFICPRGWCYLVDSEITQLNPGASAAMWHDGSGDPDKKFVLKNCTFDGPPNWYLARRHHDGHFYFIDCKFSERMRDHPPYRQRYPLSGGTPTQSDIERNARYDRTNQFGDRNYFFNSRRVGGDYPWHRDNLETAPGAPTPDQITAEWTFAGTWNPERTDPPRVVEVDRASSGDFIITFSEAVTVKGKPRLVFAKDAWGEYVSGSGGRRLVFSAAKASSTSDRLSLDLSDSAIVACEAGASLRLVDAASSLPLPATAAGSEYTLPAFPGAEGFGATTPGGRGGRVIFVTNLNDSGPGSFRAACEATGPRIVVFRVSGTIALKSDIIVTEPYITIAGQTAPGEGICLRDATFGIATHDVVVRYLRSRLGDETRRTADAFDVLHGSRNVVLDHISATWSIDEALSLSGNNQYITIQWCLIGESLRESKHRKGAHGFGTLARANGPVTFHHNLWIHNDGRNPRLGDNYGRGNSPTFDVRNNVIYNYGGTASGLTQGILKVNYVANYIRPGPSSRARTPITIGPNRSSMDFFIRDNVFDGNEELTRDNTRFFSQVEADGTRIVRIADQPIEAPKVTTVSAEEALELVLAKVGASLPKRDAVDARLVEHVRTRTGTMINSQTEVGGWPELKSATPPADADNDGIADDFEKRHGLDPHDPKDAAKLAPSGYTWIEEYINSLVL